MQTKNKTKQFLEFLGLWYPLNLTRRVPHILNWLTDGCCGVAPHPIKMNAIHYYLKKFSIKEFVETGTYLGETLGYIAKSQVKCTSIELSQELYEKACKRFKRNKNIRLIQGDSSVKLPGLLEKIDQPVLFWLDGHWSGGITASAESHTPISSELLAILNHRVKNHIILIDDARCFDGTNGYPQLDELLNIIRQEGSYNIEVSADIVRLTPQTKL